MCKARTCFFELCLSFMYCHVNTVTFLCKDYSESETADLLTAASSRCAVQGRTQFQGRVDFTNADVWQRCSCGQASHTRDIAILSNYVRLIISGRLVHSFMLCPVAVQLADAIMAVLRASSALMCALLSPCRSCLVVFPAFLPHRLRRGRLPAKSMHSFSDLYHKLEQVSATRVLRGRGGGWHRKLWLSELH